MKVKQRREHRGKGEHNTGKKAVKRQEGITKGKGIGGRTQKERSNTNTE